MSITLSMGPSREERDAISKEIAASGASPTAGVARSRMMQERAQLLETLDQPSPTAERRQLLQQLILDNRNALEELETSVRRAIEAKQLAIMQSAADTANRIGEAAKDQTESLKRATWILAFATIVLAIATIVLIFVTASA